MGRVLLFTLKDNRRRMALQATLSMSLKAVFNSSNQRKRRGKNSPIHAAWHFELEGQKIPPHVNEDQHTVQPHVQTLPFTRLLEADAPIFDFSSEFFLNLFHIQPLLQSL